VHVTQCESGSLADVNSNLRTLTATVADSELRAGGRGFISAACWCQHWWDWYIYTVNTTDEFQNLSVTLPSAGMHMPWVTYLRLTWPRAGCMASTHMLLLRPSNHIYAAVASQPERGTGSGPACWVWMMTRNYAEISQSLKKIAGKNAEFARKLCWKCAKIARKLRTNCASCTQIELKNALKIGEKLPKSCV